MAKSARKTHDIISLFMSSVAGCVDWAQVSAQVTNGRLAAADVEYVANEFLPHVHYRPSIGLVVMERCSKAQSDYQRFRQTVKRIRQGLPHIYTKYVEEFGQPGGVSALRVTQIPDRIEDPQSGGDNPNSSINRKAHPIMTFLDTAPKSIVDDLQRRADLAVSRFEKGDIPLFALTSRTETGVVVGGGLIPPEGLTATGRPKRRYETKAIRLAREAARSVGTLANEEGLVSMPKVESAGVSGAATPVPESGTSAGSFPPFFMQFARHFSK